MKDFYIKPPVDLEELVKKYIADEHYGEATVLIHLYIEVLLQLLIHFKFFGGKEPSPEKRNALGRFNATHLIRFCLISDLLDSNLYSRLIKFNDFRNDIVHSPTMYPRKELKLFGIEEIKGNLKSGIKVVRELESKVSKLA